MMDIYLLLMCAAACTDLGKKDRARDYLMEALSLGMSHGLLTPFVENVATLNGHVEECVHQHYLQVYPCWPNGSIYGKIRPCSTTALLGIMCH